MAHDKHWEVIIIISQNSQEVHQDFMFPNLEWEEFNDKQIWFGKKEILCIVDCNIMLFHKFLTENSEYRYLLLLKLENYIKWIFINSFRILFYALTEY